MYKKISALLTIGILAARGLQASALDPSFDPGTGANGLVENALVLPASAGANSGKILICGNFTTINGFTNSYIARLNSSGSVDTSFNASVSYWVRTMALQPDGKIVIGGFFTSVAGQPHGLVARLNADGTVDNTFLAGQGANGILGIAVDGDADPFVFATAVQSDGKILITGNFTNYNGVNINGIARLNTDGSLDTNFNVGAGLNFASWGRSLLIQGDGKILVTGWFQSYNNQPYNRMVRLNPDGSADTTFNPYFGDLTAVYGAVELPNKQYVVVGDSQNTNVYFARDMAELNSDGSFDTNFLAVSTDKTESVRLLANGKILISGYFSFIDGVPRTSIAQLNADGSLDTNFNVAVDNFIWSTAVQPDNKIVVVGGFNTIDGVSRHSIARLYPEDISGAPATTGGPVIRLVTPAAVATRVLTNVVNVTGTARSAAGVSAVYIENSPGSVTSSSGTTNFSAALNLSPGTNVVTIRAVDPVGNISLVTREFIYAAPEVLTLTHTGNGTVSPNLNGATLRAGTSYVLAAIPAPGSVFNGWTGSVTSSSPVLRFTMEAGVTLQANFIPNPFLGSVGTYEGLIYNAGGVTNLTSGFLVFTLGAAGNYSARLTLDTAVYAWAGRLSNDLTALEIIPRRGQSSLTVNLVLSGDVVAVSLTDGALVANGNIRKSGFSLAHPATNYAGFYTVPLPGGVNGLPAGDGYLAITVANSGVATLSGMLADGTAFVRGSPVSADGNVFFYVSYKGGANYAFGLVTLPATTNLNNVGGFYHWGTSTTGESFGLAGARYVRKNLVADANETLTLTGGDLAQTIDQTLSLTALGKFVVATPNTNHFTVTLNPANGVFSGTFIDPATHKAAVLHGVLLLPQNIGEGFFLSAGQSGTVSVSP